MSDSLWWVAADACFGAVSSSVFQLLSLPPVLQQTLIYSTLVSERKQVTIVSGAEEGGRSAGLAMKSSPERRRPEPGAGW